MQLLKIFSIIWVALSAFAIWDISFKKNIKLVCEKGKVDLKHEPTDAEATTDEYSFLVIAAVVIGMVLVSCAWMII